MGGGKIKEKNNASLSNSVTSQVPNQGRSIVTKGKFHPEATPVASEASISKRNFLLKKKATNLTISNQL